MKRVMIVAALAFMAVVFMFWMGTPAHPAPIGLQGLPVVAERTVVEQAHHTRYHQRQYRAYPRYQPRYRCHPRFERHRYHPRYGYQRYCADPRYRQRQPGLRLHFRFGR